MDEDDCLPLLLISTSDSACANKFLADLMEKDWPLLDKSETEVDRVWHLENKYYRADVGIYVWPDSAVPPPLTARVEAHLIYMLATEDDEYAERRAAAVEDNGVRPHVRLLVMEGTETEALAAWALHRRYELVSLLDGQYCGDDGDDAWGVSRARAALHAHTWNGLVRLDSAGAVIEPPDSLLDSSEEDDEEAWGEWEQWREGEAWNLVGAAQASRGALGVEPDGERRERAEALLQAFLSTLRPRAP